MKKLILTCLPIFIIISFLLTFYLMGLDKYFSLEILRHYSQQLKAFVVSHFLFSSLIFIGVYIVIVTLSLPLASFLSLVGGFLFRQPWSTVYVICSATIGATIIFFIAKTSLGRMLKNTSGKHFEKIQVKIRKNAVYYLLFLRLMPIFPFWLMNLAPGLLGVKIRTFVWTTAVGIAPGAFVFTQAGAGLGVIFAADEPFSIDSIFNRQIRIALIALGIMTFIPLILKKWRENKNA